jgi:hypothetical protein
MVPISDGNLVPEIAQVAEGLEFIDGHAIPLENSKKRVWAVCIAKQRLFSSPGNSQGT